MSNTHQVNAPPPTSCPECGSPRIPVEAINSVRLVKPGTAVPGITGGFTEMWALMCIACGHTTFYAKDPAKLQR